MTILLKNLGASQKLIILLIGESIITSGIVTILFEIVLNQVDSGFFSILLRLIF